MLMGLNIKAQEKFTSYYNVYTEKNYEIQLNFEEDSFWLWIDALSLDQMVTKAGFLVKKENYQGFISALKIAIIKYQEWVKVAKENNVKEFDKEMPVTSEVAGYFLYGSDWYFQFNVFLDFDFKILESNGEIKYLLIVRSGKMQSSKNEYIDIEDVVLVFSSAKETLDFLNSISLEKIETFKNKPKTEDLFK